MIQINNDKVPEMAPGVKFNEDSHTYFLQGKKLSGVTGKIGKKLGKNFAGAGNLMDESISEGNAIHKWIENWVKTGKWDTVHSNAIWGKDALCAKYSRSLFANEINYAFAEVLVSDFAIFASAIDILVSTSKGWDIIDTKTGNVDLEYLAWQCGCYKMFLEARGHTVNKCYCLATKDKLIYRIKPKSVEEVRGLLYAETT